jgi:hypothetical protein
MYEFYSDASETVTIGTAGVQARIDIICLKVDASTGVASIVAVAGTPSGSPAVPATPASHYKLAEIAVGISVTTITNANITDTRRSVFVAPTGARNQGFINGKIVPTVASNNLTVAIKTLADTDPSATNPVGIWIGNQLKWITGALSITTGAGFNAFNAGSAELATREIDLFAYIFFKASDATLQIGISRIPYGCLYSDFSSTITNEKYVSTLVGLASSDICVNVGRFAATLSAGAGYTWTVPAFTNANLIQEPIYETRWLEWLPTYSASGSMTYTSVTTVKSVYQITNRTLNISLASSGTTGGTASTQINATLPITLASTTNGAYSFSGIAEDTSPIGAAINNSSNNIIRFIKIGSNWGLGASRVIRGAGSVPIVE